MAIVHKWTSYKPNINKNIMHAYCFYNMESRNCIE
jgi:hypothetical protein